MHLKCLSLYPQITVPLTAIKEARFFPTYEHHYRNPLPVKIQRT